jgi:hypothetical protein
MNEKKDVERNLNPKLKDFSTKELGDEISNRSDLFVLATNETISLKAGTDLMKLMGLTFKALMEITMILKSVEMKNKAGGIVIPGTNVPGNIRGH